MDLGIPEEEGLGMQEGTFALHASAESSEELRFEQLPLNAAMDLFVSENIEIPLPLKVDSLTFLKAEQNQTYSSIIGGSISFPEAGINALSTHSFQYPDRLEMNQDQLLSLERLSLTDSGIFLRFSAEITKIEKLKAGERINLKANRYRWIWHQHRELTLAIGAVILAFLLLLPGPISKRIVEVIGTLLGWYKG